MPEDEYTVPIGEARVVTEGDDVTVTEIEGLKLTVEKAEESEES